MNGGARPVTGRPGFRLARF